MGVMSKCKFIRPCLECVGIRGTEHEVAIDKLGERNSALISIKVHLGGLHSDAKNLMNHSIRGLSLGCIFPSFRHSLWFSEFHRIKIWRCLEACIQVFSLKKLASAPRQVRHP